MQFDKHFSNKSLVAAVEKYEELYNKHSDNYSNRNAQRKAWLKVANELKSSVEECKSRWRMLRISLVRYLKSKNQRGSSGKKKKPYYLENAMKFVIPFAQPQSHSENTDSNLDGFDSFMSESYPGIEFDESLNAAETPQGIVFEPSLNVLETPQEHFEGEEQMLGEKLVEVEHRRSRASLEVSVHRPPVVFSRKRKREKATLPSSARCSCTCTNRQKDIDSDLLFLKSLLPDLKQLNDAQKRRFKQRIFMVYDEIVNEEPELVNGESIKLEIE